MIELLIDGRVGLRDVDGELRLPKQPPFDIITPGAAAVVDLEVDPEDQVYIRLFDTWYRSGKSLDVIVFDGRATYIRAAMECVGIEKHQGIQITRAWSEPLRKSAATANGANVARLYRPTPRFQQIAKPVYRYQLAAQSYGFIGRDAMMRVEHGNDPDQAG